MESTKIIIMISLLFSGDACTSDKAGSPVKCFQGRLNEIFCSDLSDADKTTEMENILCRDLKDQKDFLAQEGSASKTNDPGYFEFLGLMTARKDAYFKAQGLQKRSEAAAILFSTVTDYHEKKMNEQRQAERSEEVVTINNYCNFLKKSATQQSAIQIPRLGAKAEVPTTTREQRRTAQKEAVKAAKKAAKRQDK